MSHGKQCQLAAPPGAHGAPGAGVVPVPSLMSSIFKPLELVMKFEPSLAAYAGNVMVPMAAICSICRLAIQAASCFGTRAVCAHTADAIL